MITDEKQITIRDEEGNIVYETAISSAANAYFNTASLMSCWG